MVPGLHLSLFTESHEAPGGQGHRNLTWTSRHSGFVNFVSHCSSPLWGPSAPVPSPLTSQLCRRMPMIPFGGAGDPIPGPPGLAEEVVHLCSEASKATPEGLGAAVHPPEYFSELIPGQKVRTCLGTVYTGLYRRGIGSRSGVWVWKAEPRAW